MGAICGVCAAVAWHRAVILVCEEFIQLLLSERVRPDKTNE